MKGELGVTVKNGASALGERCNNPLNIMGGGAFQGKVGEYRNSAGTYYVFGASGDHPGWIMGMRAAFVDWNTKHRRMGGLTIEKLIRAWAPPDKPGAAVKHKNDTEAYIRFVTRQTGYSPAQPLIRGARGVDCAVMRAMIEKECGRCIYSDDEIALAWDLAHGVKQLAPITATTTGQGVTIAAVATAAQALVEPIGSVVAQLSTDVHAAAAVEGPMRWVLIAVSGLGALMSIAGMIKNRREPT